MEKDEYEKRITDLDAAVGRLTAELDSMHKRADALQKSINSSSSEECKRRSKQLIADIERGANVVAKCTTELGRKDAALKTCVRMYEDVKSVYDPSK